MTGKTRKKLDPLPSHICQTGDCILLRGESFISKSIRKFTNSEWSHVAIYVGGGKRKTIDASLGGVRVSTIDKLMQDASAICIRRIPNLTVEEAERMKDKAYSMVYQPYDVPQFLSLGLYFILSALGINANWIIANGRSRYICSEAYAVCALTIPLEFADSVKQVVPETLFKTDLMNTIYYDDILEEK